MRLASVEKALKVLDYLAKNPRGCTLSELSRGLDINKSSVHHLLSTLIPYDYVAQDEETRKYTLGFKFLSIGRTIIENMDVRNVAAEHLRQLHESCGEATHLAILRQGKVVYIDKIDKPGGLSLATYVGFATDPHSAAGGKVLLSELSDWDVAEMYRGREFTAYARKTITCLEDFLAELAKVREMGYAIDDEEYYEGARCVAAPVRAGGKIVAALSITGSIFSLTMERLESELIPEVVETARKISAAMCW